MRKGKDTEEPSQLCKYINGPLNKLYGIHLRDSGCPVTVAKKKKKEKVRP